MSETSTSATRQIARGAGLVMAAFVLSNLVGLLRQILMTAAFGTEADMEAFNAANRVSEILFNLLAGGALASAFIPTFTALLTVRNQRGAWKLASAVANLLLVILTLASALAAVFAPQIVRYILAPGFADDPAKTTLTIESYACDAANSGNLWSERSCDGGFEFTPIVLHPSTSALDVPIGDDLRHPGTFTQYGHLRLSMGGSDRSQSTHSSANPFLNPSGWTLLRYFWF